MGMAIDAVATATPRHRWSRHGALHLTDVAARACLARGRHQAHEIDLLINVGLYRDHMVAEPAFASLVQDDIDAKHGTFSFDVLGGGCGVVEAAFLAHAFIAEGPAQLAMVVAGDAGPAMFRATSGALLLRHIDGDAGFQRFLFRTYVEDADLFEAAIHWRDGHNLVDVSENPRFSAHAVEHAIEVAQAILHDANVTASEIDVLVASAYPASFAGELARGLGIQAPPLRIADESHAHTAGPLFNLEAAITSGAFARAHYTLFVTAGAGVTIAAALYEAAP